MKGTLMQNRKKKLGIAPQIFTVVSGVLLLLILGCTHAFGSQNIASKADDYVRAYVEMNRFSGSVLIARKGEILLKKGYGMANYEHNVPNTPQAKFRIASLTKSFTALAVLQLQEQGLLNINDSIGKFIPDYPNGDKITVHHLLSHTSGIPNFTVATDEKARVMPFNLEMTIKKFKDLPLEFSPGEKFEYSNAGYYLLGYIIEKVTGRDYATVIKHNIFEPLGMTDSGYDHNHLVIKNRAYGYRMEKGELINAKYIHMDNVHASGGLYSTIGDMYLWDRALYTEKLVKQKSLNQMFTPVGKNYGYGWGIVTLFNRKMVGHNGDMEGFQTNITRFIDDDVCIIVLSNFGHAPIGKISVDLAAIVFGEKYQIPQKHVTKKIDFAIYDDYVGRYEVNSNFSFIISRKDDHLFCQPTGQNKLELFPESETNFFLKEVDAQIVFVRDEEGKVIKLILHQSGRVISAKKIK
jgi:CubicO group peptidase (beta-lactamase class C family)